MKKCRQCQAENPDHSPYCGMCGSELPHAETGSSPEVAGPIEIPALDIPVEEQPGLRYPDHGSMARTGGILIVISGIVVILTGIVSVAFSTYIGVLFGVDELLGFVLGGMLIIACGVVTVLAGREAVRGRHWTFALVGCVISMLFWTVPLILGVIGLVFICVARDDFLV